MQGIRTAATLAILLVAATAASGDESARWTTTVAPGESIQAAVDAAPAGGVICLGEGVWDEHLTIAKSLTILGSQAGTTIRGRDENVPVIRVHAPGGDEVTVVLVTLTLTGGAGWDGPGLFVGNTARVTVTDSAIQRNGKYGMHVRGSSQVTITHSTIGQNGSSGIFMSDAALASVTYSRVEGNAGNGVTMEGSSRVVMASSTLVKNVEAGVCVRLSAQAAIVGSTIEGNKYGIIVDPSGQVTVTDSTLQESQWDGIVLGGSAGLVLERSRVIRNGRYGVALYEQPGCDLSNTFTGRITGCGNRIPGPGEEDANGSRAFCPDQLAFLISEDGGELDLRE